MMLFRCYNTFVISANTLAKDRYYMQKYPKQYTSKECECDIARLDEYMKYCEKHNYHLEDIARFKDTRREDTLDVWTEFYENGLS